jgi:hypothetical protein
VRVMKAKKSAQGVAVRGVKNRRLVLCVAKSLEPIAVNVLVSDIMQVAVLPVGKNEQGEARYTVAAQIGPEQWVRLAVFDTATEAELLIESVANVISGSRWPDLLLMAGMSIVAGFIFVTLGAYYVNSRNPSASAPTAAATYGVPTAQLGQEDDVTMTIPAAPVAPPAFAQPSPAQAAGAAAGMQLTPDNEDAMKAYFGSKK